MKIITLFIISILLTGLVGAYQEEQPQAWKTGECRDFIQTSYSCSSIILDSITNPDKTIDYPNIAMTKTGSTFSYSYCANNGTGSGSFNTVCPDYNISAPVSFKVTNSGDSLETSNSLLYIFILFINFLLLAFFIFCSIGIDGANNSNENGLIEVNHKKYLKMGSIFLAYIMSIWFSFNMYKVSSSYLNLDFMSNLFNSVFNFLLSAITPVIIGFVIFIGYWVVKDSKLKDMFEGGLNNEYG